MRHFDFHGAKNVFVHSRNFGSIELDVALHKLQVQHCCLARKSWNRRPRYKRLWCGLWNLVHLFRHKTRLCVWQNHSLFCHFNPFAFLHLICDGALTCSSIHLLWKQYHRNQEVGRLGHVHGNDFGETHLLSSQILHHGSSPWFFSPSSRPVSYCPFTSLVWFLETAQRRREPNCAVVWQCPGGKPQGPSTFPTVCGVSIPE